MKTSPGRLQARDAWAARLAGGQFRHLFDHLGSTLFFAKDLEGRITFANTAFARHCGYASENDVVGLTDGDLFAPALAQHYRAGDRKVLDSGRPVLGIIELFPNALGQPEWYQTNKLPLFDQEGALCGLCGTVRSYEGARAALQPYLDLAPAVDYLKDHYTENLDVARLARLSGLSVRQFQRRFRQTFQMSPRAYLIRLRVALGAELLSSTGRRPTEIALELGFYDHSDFSRQFRKIMGTPPSDYRRAHARV